MPQTKYEKRKVALNRLETQLETKTFFKEKDPGKETKRIGKEIELIKKKI